MDIAKTEEHGQKPHGCGTPPHVPAGAQLWAQYHALTDYALYQQDGTSRTMYIRFNGIADLPVGRGKRFFGSASRFVNELIGGFHLAGDGDIASDLLQPTSQTLWGRTNPLVIYKHKEPIMDCRSGVCDKSYLWYNGYLAPSSYINCTSDCATGLPGSYRPVQQFIDNTPGSRYYQTNDVLVTLANGEQEHDSYPVRALNGEILIINPFDGEPYDRYEPHDGYDIYRIADGWASVGETKDGGGFSTTFFGANCKPYNGWVFFPASALASSQFKSGEAKMPIDGNYWEHNGESWPGKCPAAYNENSLTTWEFLHAYPFGGIGGNPVKRIDAIRPVHGSPNRPNFITEGHLEVFYFGKLYGATRWETWRPLQQVRTDPKTREAAAKVSGRCGQTGNVKYRGVQFAVTACQDWSAVRVLGRPELRVPWPVPDMNLLKNFHFGNGFANWQHTTPSVPDSAMQLSLKNSTLPLDARFIQGGQDVRYLAFGCAAECSSANVLYQDVPVSANVTSGRYTFGAEARSEGHDCTVRFAVSTLDSSGKILGEQSFTATLATSNGKFNAGESFHLSSEFVVTTVPITIDSKVSFLRFSISPGTSGTFDIVDAWLMKDTY
ncbi:MAG: hypothetical protein ACLGQX_06875 [Acidobacteriota bacterium]